MFSGFVIFRSTQSSGVLGSVSAHYNDSDVLGRYLPFRARVFLALPPLITTTRAFSVVILRSEHGCSQLCLRSLQRLGCSRSLSCSPPISLSDASAFTLTSRAFRHTSNSKCRPIAASRRARRKVLANQASASPRVTSRRRVRSFTTTL